MKKLGLTASGLAAVMLISGCATTPMGPTVRAMPPAGKPFEVFQADNAYCKDYARTEVAGQAEANNDRAVGTALLGAALGAGVGAVAGGGRGAAVGAAAGGGGGALIGASNSQHSEHGIQYQYDNAYAQCMSAKGNSVQGHATVTVVHPMYAPPPTVVYTPPPVVYTAPPGAVPAPPPQTGYAPPPGAVAPPAGMAPPQ
jgi:uncharacterized protein YcfJ